MVDVLRAWRFRHNNARNYAANLTPIYPLYILRLNVQVASDIYTSRPVPPTSNISRRQVIDREAFLLNFSF
jgi:hypothetical protein